MTTVTAIVLSYQRPRMLREALATVAANRPDEVIFVDDGSDFNVYAIGLGCLDAAIQLISAPPMTVEERLITPRLGSLINQALGMATGDVIAYLCDDDLWAPGWLDAVRAHFDADPPHAFVRGNWLEWRDGEPLATATVCQMPGFWMTTGNFAHRNRPELRWDETTVACHDASFLHLAGAHGHAIFHVPYLDVLAGFRRLHRHNALNYVQGVAEYAPNARELFAGGWLE